MLISVARHYDDHLRNNCLCINSDINNNIDLINFIQRFREIVLLNSTVYYCSDRPTLVTRNINNQPTCYKISKFVFLFVYYSSNGNLVIYPQFSMEHHGYTNAKGLQTMIMMIAQCP